MSLSYTSPVRARRIAGAAALTLMASAGAVGVLTVVTTAGSSAATCSDVDVVFARGTGEAQGLGTVGRPFVDAVTSALPGRSVTSYAVVYAANTSQSSAEPGSADLTNHVISVAAACPGTAFVLGGYSQGATVVDKALGIRTGSGGGTPIPAALSSRVASAVAFGNPLGLQGQTIATASPTYGARSRDYCNSGDPVCGGGGNIAAHLQYASNGSAAAGGRFAAALVPARTTPTPTPTPTPTTAPTTAPPVTVCVRDDTRDHVRADRAVELFGRAYARGSRDSLGLVSSFNIVSLRQTAPSTWVQVNAC